MRREVVPPPRLLQQEKPFREETHRIHQRLLPPLFYDLPRKAQFVSPRSQPGQHDAAYGTMPHAVGDPISGSINGSISISGSISGSIGISISISGSSLRLVNLTLSVG